MRHNWSKRTLWNQHYHSHTGELRVNRGQMTRNMNIYVMYVKIFNLLFLRLFHCPNYWTVYPLHYRHEVEKITSMKKGW